MFHWKRKSRAIRYARLVGTLLVVFLVILFGSIKPSMAIGGRITNLTAGVSGNTLTINVSLLADTKIVNSILEVSVVYGGVTYRTFSAPLPDLNVGDTWSTTWTTDITASSPSPFPATGNYDLVACWSPGNALNCSLATSTTTFYSAPSLGWLLSIGVILLLGVFLSIRRRDFSSSQRAE